MRRKQADNQSLLFMAHLEQILDHNHPLFKLAHAIDWPEFEQVFGKLYDPEQGWPAKPIRLMVGLHYLKHAYDLSDEDVVARWVGNPYWQYFCGRALADPSSSATCRPLRYLNNQRVLSRGAG